MSDKIYEIESYYDILTNDDDEIMCTIKQREDEPADPELFYAGAEHAVLRRGADHYVILDFIHPGVRELLARTSEVLMVEIGDGKLVREYVVNVQMVDKLPVPEEELPTLD